MEFLLTIKNIVRVVGIRETVIAMGFFSVGIVLLAWFSVKDANSRLAQFETEKSHAAETYLQVKSMDLSEVSHALERRAAELENRYRRVFSRSWEPDYLPVLLSRIEEQATQSKLGIVLVVEDIPEKYPREKLPGTRHVRLDITGKYIEIMDFINRLESWDEILMIHEFRISRTDDAADRLRAEMEIVIPELRTDG